MINLKKIIINNLIQWLVSEVLTIWPNIRFISFPRDLISFYLGITPNFKNSFENKIQPNLFVTLAN